MSIDVGLDLVGDDIVVDVVDDINDIVAGGGSAIDSTGFLVSLTRHLDLLTNHFFGTLSRTDKVGVMEGTADVEFAFLFWCHDKKRYEVM